MSKKYKFGDIVPTKILCARLDELGRAVAKGGDAIDKAFRMRVPAEVELDIDADYVLCASADRLKKLRGVICAAIIKFDKDGLRGPANYLRAQMNSIEPESES